MVWTLPRHEDRMPRGVPLVTRTSIDDVRGTRVA